jgi:hypothetical protein
METWHVAVLCLIIALFCLAGADVVYMSSGMTAAVAVFLASGLFFAAVGVIVAIMSFARLLKKLEAALKKE